MKEALVRLIDLQRADKAAAQTGKRRDEIDAKAREAEKLLTAAKAAEDEAHKAVQEAKSAQHSLENDLREREARIQTMNGKLGGATSNKEYQSIVFEIGLVRAECGKVEEKILLAMDEVEAKDRLWEAAKARTRETEGIVRAAKAEVDLRRTEFEAELAAMKAEREAIAAAIPKEALRIYERIRAGNRTTGTAVVAVHGEYCQGCQMSITSQELSDLVGGTKIVLCRSCQRILVLES